MDINKTFQEIKYLMWWSIYKRITKNSCFLSTNISSEDSEDSVHSVDSVDSVDSEDLVDLVYPLDSVLGFENI